MRTGLLPDRPERRPDFERLRTALYCGQPDRVPLVELGMPAREALLGRPIVELADVVEFQWRAGYDYVVEDIFNREEIGISDDELGLAPARRAAGGKEWIETWVDFGRFPWPAPGKTLAFLGGPENLLPPGMKVIPLSGLIFDAAYLLRFKKLCLIGNIDIGYTLSRGTPAETAAETRQRLRELGPGGGYCVSCSNSITDYVKTENYFAMIETTLKYGRYSR